MNKNPRLYVIGGLAAGPSAASKAKRVNPDAEVVLIEQTQYISYGICEIPYYLSGEYESRNDLVVYSPERLREKKGVRVLSDHRVEEIDRKARTITIFDRKRRTSNTAEYDKLILATGSKPNLLQEEHLRADNLFTVKELGAAYRLHAMLKDEQPRRAVVVGGGYIGLELCETFRRLAIDVTLLHRHEYPFTGTDPAIGELIVSELRSNGVRFVLNENVTGFEMTKEGKVRSVVSEKHSYEADIVILAIGVSPNVSLAADAGIVTGELGGVRADERQLTNDGNIYAAGDCCEVKNCITGRPTYLPLATVASKTGRTAGENAAGGNSTFRGAIKNVAVRLFALEIARVGLTDSEAHDAGYHTTAEVIEAPSRVVGMPGAEKLTVRYVADTASGKLLGASFVGKDGAAQRANVIASMLRMGATVADISQLDLMYAPPFSTLWDPILIAANQTLNKL